MKLWQKKLITSTLSTMLFFLLCLYLFYVIVDLTTHSVRFFTYGELHLGKLFLYYLHQFIKRADIFLPLTFLLSSIKILCSLNSNNEIIALYMAGISKKKILSLFIHMSILLCVLAIINCQWMLPRSLNFIERFEKNHLQDKSLSPEGLFAKALSDKSKLIYQSYDTYEKNFSDVYWIRSLDDIWHMKTLSYNAKPVGNFVDHLERDEQGRLQKTASYEKYLFSDLKLQFKIRKENVPAENHSLSTLFLSVWKKQLSSFKEKQEFISYIFYKIINCFTALLVTIIVIPLCIQFSRNVKSFSFFALAICLLFGFFTIMDATLILSENGSHFSLFYFLFPLSAMLFASIYMYKKKVLLNG